MQRADDGQHYSYTAGDLSAQAGKAILRFELEVINKSSATQQFRVGDVTVRDLGSPRDLAAVGTGDYLFVKSGKDLDVVKNRRLTIEPGKTLEIMYAFGVSKDSSSWKLAYGKHQAIELKGVAKLLPP